ncbi:MULTISPECIES: Bug family tripartite tricarboxylate transporter substrate binding protein [Achromobacter]|uniref:Tripartite tricarboxylate transporter substrate binding protein n=1 Tax=Alcaligenes xylosoxydans xylosoxydans TaxID=85698 RepID=A0A9X3L2Z4_ALCXX|nr:MULTISPECIES: tripartite tricarboxylate transporter substrate binding protein [Achromobacter]MCZ8404784.1 tripartite tricarboxylate transporter substrate binding protein [Achromobacter xylosoxidans]OMG79095.1 hypothetical protein BIZ53_31380 [Achromobacter xylosoxidans]
MNFAKKTWCSAYVAATLAVCPMLVGAAEAYPSQPIRIVDAYPAGGSTDVLARYLGSRISSNWGQPVVVENRGGASGQIGANYVAKSKADGYTFLVTPNPDILILGPLLYKHLPYVRDDFVPVAIVADVPLVLVVNSQSGIGDVKQLITRAKSEPQKLTYGSAGQGSTHHLSAELFTKMAEIEMIHVPFRGTAPAVQDLLGGHVDMVISPISAVLPHIKAGKLKALAVTGTKRAQALPNIPTLTESSLPGYESTLWVSLVAPKGTPEPILKKWNDAVSLEMKSEEARAMLAEQGIESASASMAEIRARIDRETQRWRTLIESRGIVVE